jgi:hypothetical protein
MAGKHIRTFSDFLAKVKKEKNGCWSIDRYHTPKGYARIRCKNKKYLAHRLSFELFHGKKAGKLLVCHKCDNPGCVNPRHLFLGDWKDNVQDCIKKGRFRGWDNSPFRKGNKCNGR